MLTNLQEAKNESVILELSEGQDAGCIGGYCEDGFPIYYANQKMAQILGYNDVDDLIEGIEGMVANTIHPDDLERVAEELNHGQYYDGMTYKITYRMVKKDGSFIWTVDSGKVFRAEDGRLAILSICNDMTEFIDRHAELERMNELSKSTLENMPGGYHRCAAEEGYPFLYISDRFCEMFGWTREEIKTKFDNKFSNMLHPNDVETSEEYVELLSHESNKEVIDAIYRMQGKNGYIWVSDATSLVTVGNQTFYQGTLTDITGFVERRENQEKMIKEQFAIISTLSKTYRNVFVANLQDGSTKTIRLDDGYNVKAIRDVENITFNFDVIVDRWIKESVHPEDKDRMKETLSMENLRKVFAAQDKLMGTYRNIEDGELHYYQYDFRRIGDTDNVVAGFQIVDTIIEEQKAHQKAEREHVEVINSLSAIYSTIFTASIDTHEYEILASIPLMAKVAPRTGNFDDVKTTIIESFMEPEYRATLSDFLNLDTLADRLEKVDTVTTDYKAPTGQWMQARFIVKRRDETGRAREVLYVARDITIEKIHDIEQQEALTNALISAQQASKAKTTFLNSMSHDIRTPMNAIIGFTALAQTHSDDQALVQEYLSKISTSGTHLLSLINDILDMSRIESGTVKLEEKEVHLPDLLHDLRTIVQGLVNSKNLNLFIDTQDVLHEDVFADKLRLNQILLNIISNAVKFTQPGGDIIIRLVEKPCKRVQYASYEFSVKDNGIGMSEDFMGHIFESFTREYSATVSGIQGTGLGMAITKNIVDMMGGEIKVESQVGKGSLFTVSLDFAYAYEPRKYEPIPELLGEKVLVVDDDINTCRSVCRMLRDIRMRPDWTTSGKEAIIRAQDAAELKEEYKVYIIDYLMPDMNGIETVRRIRKVINEDVPIIVLTAYDWGDFETEAREAGVTAFVSKPIFMSELKEVLTQPTAEANAHKKTKKKRIYDYSGKRVLLVEDNEINREIATAILEETGMIIDSVCDGDEAVITINREPADKYDMIFMDVQMPRMDGYTATREIRTLPDNRKANIPIVAMTANAFEEDRRKAFESGMNGHIIKPINIDSIAVVLDEIFGLEQE